MNNLTELKMLEYQNKYRSLESPILYTTVAKMGDQDILLDALGEPVHADFHTYLTGPIADRLYEYEQLGMDPIDIKEALDELARWRAAYKDVGKEFDVKPPAKPDSKFVQEFMDSVTTQAQSKGMDVLVFLTSDGKVHAKFAQPEKPMKWQVLYKEIAPGLMNESIVCGNCGKGSISREPMAFCAYCGEMMHGVEAAERSGDEDE